MVFYVIQNVLSKDYETDVFQKIIIHFKLAFIEEVF